MIYSFHLVIMLACAVFYYKVGEAEYSSGILLAGISVLLWLGTAYGLQWGVLGCLLVQAGLSVLLTVWNGLRRR